jgi:hypothetical protein
MTMFQYNYKTIADCDVCELYGDNNARLNESLNLKNKSIIYNDSQYGIIKYDKNKLTADNVNTTGMFRSVVYKNNRILVVSPQKSSSYDSFITQHNLEQCVVEEYVEGTMINMFYDQDIEEWELATRSTVGGKVNYFISRFTNINFREMFLEACNNASFEFSILDKTLCYSFVLQHPKNRIVVPFKETRIYLTACYRINEDYMVDVIDVGTIKDALAPANIHYPKRYENINEVYNLTELMSTSFSDYTVVGLMIHHHPSGMRCKIRNEGTYEYVRRLRGNQPKEQFRYLELCHDGRIEEYLKFYPEDSESFNKYCDQVNYFINALYNNYVDCFIYKKGELKNYPHQYKSHMYSLQQLYLNTIKPGNMQYNNVVTYIIGLPPAKLMYSLNYHLRV